MAVFYDNDITNKGRQLMAELLNGTEFVPTEIIVGSGFLPKGITTRTITDVVNPVKSFTVSKSEKLPDGSYVFGGIFSNEDITTDFEFRELALKAKGIRPDGTELEEILYSYGNAGNTAETIPAYGTSTAIERQMDIIVYIGNDAIVNLEIKSGTTVDREEFDSEMEKIYEILSQKVDLENGKGLSSNDYTTTEKSKVSNLPADTSAEFNKKVDKEEGKGLSTNDYTAMDKNKVSNLPADTNALLAGKADKSNVSLATLLASGWSNGQYSFEGSYPKATYDLSVEPDSSCTEAQLDAWSEARIVGSSAGNVLKAYGDVPTVDIPVILEVKKK